MTVRKYVEEAALKQGIRMIRKNPERNLVRFVDWAQRLDTEKLFPRTWNWLKGCLENPSDNWNLMIHSALRDIDPHVMETILVNFIVNAGLDGYRESKELEKKLGVQIPWCILMDPTTACNLKCTGCWAAEYGKNEQMEYELLDRIICQGKDLGIHFYIYSGGEPMVRKDDILRLAQRHGDCAFLMFTNGTLIDDSFAEKARHAGNIAFAVSVEGLEAETDMRRGAGTYRRAMRAMDVLKAHGLLFGFSTCYHKYNTEMVGSDEYIDRMIEKGCKFGWYFTYIPIGNNAHTDLIATPQQREHMYHQVRHFRVDKPIFALDFWNDGEYVGGCIAGGKRYFHINSAGDVEPCAFIHYSDTNIRNVSLLDALKSPLFQQYQSGQPFSDNMLRPCPLMDNPEALQRMVQECGAHSTQPGDREDVCALCGKCLDAAGQWKPVADKLWSARA